MVEKFLVVNKPAMRDMILKQRKLLEPVSLTNEIDISTYKNIYIYESLQGEVQTDEFIKNLIAIGKKVFVPQGDGFIQTRHCEHNTKTFGLSVGRGNPVPLNKIKFTGLLRRKLKFSPRNDVLEIVRSDRNDEAPNLAPPDLIIVPALAYSKNGDRLGRGGGWYDKFLSKYPDVKKIGIIQKEFVFENLPTEAHDVKVDEVIVIGETKDDENESD